MKVYSKSSSRLPDRAGKAELKYKDIARPIRRNDIITLPSRGWELYWLKIDQFLCVSKKKEVVGYSSKEARKTWFGGTDEQPFLVEMEELVWTNGGEWVSWLDVWKQELFYDCIKPPIITHYEKTYGLKTKRQGDIFTVPLPEQNWNKLLDLMMSMSVDDEIYPEDSRGRKTVFGTRHVLHGYEIIQNSTTNAFVGKGLLEAPDHKELNLKETCLFAQTRFLNNPKKAD